MHNQAYQLLGQWMVGLISSYFANQRALNSDKLFIKVTGVDDDALGYVLEVVSEAEERLREYYLPHIRTLAAVPGYEKYQCQAHETSTWLRNNTKQGSALLIFMNAESPEAQSLENIFTVDEARLLSEDGLKVLFDAEHLRRVLVNLLDNAWRHADDGPGAIRVTLAEDADAVELVVRKSCRLL